MNTKTADSMMRVGIVSVLDEETCSARVTFDDQDDITTDLLPVLVRNTQENSDYWMPAVDEQVLCLFLGVGLEQGFILGSFYDETKPPPANSAKKRVTRFSDGTTVGYDSEAKELLVNAVGDITIIAAGNVLIKAQEVTIDAPETIMTGNALVKGTLTYQNGISGSAGSGSNTITGDVSVTGGELSVDGIGVKAHHHTAQGENSPTTAAQK